MFKYFSKNSRYIYTFFFFILLFSIYLGNTKSNSVNKKFIQKIRNIKTENGVKSGSDAPFPMPSEENLIHWDSGHYWHLKEYGYYKSQGGGDYQYAFFPGFPLLWRATHLNNIGIIILNFLLFLSSLFILDKTLKKVFINESTIPLFLTLPSIIIFFIPYSEALSFFVISISLYFLVSEKRLWAFLFLLISATIRPSFTFFLIAIVLVELFALIRTRKTRDFLLHLLLRVLPIILGTVFVILFQHFQDSPKWFQFYHAQEYWGHKLAFPSELKDWSTLGFGINIALLVFMVIPLGVLIAYATNSVIRKMPSDKTEISKQDYLFILSILYLVGISAFSLLFRQGSLHCLFRFTLCTPFAFIALGIGMSKAEKVNIWIRLIILTIICAFGYFLLSTLAFSKTWHLDDSGFFLLASSFILGFSGLSKTKFKFLFTSLLLIANAIWTAYLFNWYLNDGWIFA